MRPCDLQSSDVIALYFYGEMPAAEREAFERHMAGCADCRHAVADLSEIRAALKGRPDDAAPPGGDWSGFMARLDANIRRERPAIGGGIVPFRPRTRRIVLTYVAMAALIALVTFSVLFVARNRPVGDSQHVTRSAAAGTARSTQAPTLASPAADQNAALAALSEQHFERSKLVVLGLEAKDARHASARDWAYERQLASSLLTDTRLYRLAAEQHGMTSLARVMGDLELVLLQTSMAEDRDPESLEQLQRLIRKRNLVTNMELVTTGL